jgi:hypothetical protein
LTQKRPVKLKKMSCSVFWRAMPSDEKVFRADSLESLRGAPVTDLHPSEKGSSAVLTPANETH